MEVERENHPQNDPEAMKALARVQVSSLFPSLYSSCGVSYNSLFEFSSDYLLSLHPVRLKRNIHKFPMKKKCKIRL